jgi:pyruvate/2-oxoglutarate dehydrogenase complex dihydrolipoamide acyltransferase (E2) component
LPKVSRTFYAGKYDPDAKPTLPDCWSNLGDKPEAAAGSPQASNCASCPKNVMGSGENGKGRACRFQRRIALLIAGDDSGDVYQFNVPAKSLFGKGSGNVHPFESYVKFLIANGEGPDTVVTNIAYNLDAETMELQFTPMRGVNDEEYALVQAARSDPATREMIVLTVAAQEAAPAKAQEAAAPKPKVVYSDEPDDEEEEVIAEPKKRAAKKGADVVVPQGDLASVLNAWGDGDEDE